MKKGEVYETKYSRSVKIYPFDESFYVDITVTQSVDFQDLKWSPAEILWPSIGAHSVIDTDLFIRALKEASKIARKWTAEKCK